MRLIGINGKKRHGKDTTFQIVREELSGQLVQRAAFADKLKIMAALALGFDEHYTDDQRIKLMDKFKEAGSISVLYDELGTFNEFWEDNSSLQSLTGREYLQYFGGHARRVFGDTFWIDQVLPFVADKSPTARSYHDAMLQQRFPIADVVCVTDVRYPNEAERIKDLGGEVWEVLRTDIPDSGDNHATEQRLPLELVDLMLPNNGTDSYREVVRKALR